MPVVADLAESWPEKSFRMRQFMLLTLEEHVDCRTVNKPKEPRRMLIKLRRSIAAPRVRAETLTCGTGMARLIAIVPEPQYA